MLFLGTLMLMFWTASAFSHCYMLKDNRLPGCKCAHKLLEHLGIINGLSGVGFRVITSTYLNAEFEVNWLKIYFIYVVLQSYKATQYSLVN